MTSPMTFGPPDFPDGVRVLIIVVAYVVAIGFSGTIVKSFVKPPPSQTPPPPGPEVVYRPSDPRDVGALIGKCENIIVVTFVLAGGLTALAIIFTAKSLVRLDSMKSDPSWYLGGTLVNFCWSLLIGVLARLLVFGIR